LLRRFKGSGRLRERGSDADWFPIEFLTYHNERGNLRSFAYVRKADGGDIPDDHYVFLDELGERSFRWRKWKGKVAVRMAVSAGMNEVRLGTLLSSQTSLTCVIHGPKISAR